MPHYLYVGRLFLIVTILLVFDIFSCGDRHLGTPELLSPWLISENGCDPDRYQLARIANLGTVGWFWKVWETDVPSLGRMERKDPT